jgi:hypothetical protein
MPSGRALGYNPSCSCVFLWTVPAALGDHDGSAVGHLPARDGLPHDQPTAWSLCRPSRTLGALLSSDDFESSVERTATLHPLWQAQLSRPGVGSGRCALGGDAIDGGWLGLSDRLAIGAAAFECQRLEPSG